MSVNLVSFLKKNQNKTFISDPHSLKFNPLLFLSWSDYSVCNLVIQNI